MSGPTNKPSCQNTSSENLQNVRRRAIAQGSSEYNITILVEQSESIRALRAVHARFYLVCPICHLSPAQDGMPRPCMQT